MHWTEMAAWFEAHLEDFGKNDAVVFQGVNDNMVIWWWLMTGRYDRMADHMVQLPGAPVRDHAAKVAMLQERVRHRVGEALPAEPLAA
jgi:hypothetical protein